MTGIQKSPHCAGVRKEDRIETRFERNRDTLFCDVNGWVNAKSAPVLLDVLEHHWDGVRQVKIDCAKMEFISSAGLAVLLWAIRRLEKKAVCLMHVPELSRGILTLSGFHEMVTLIPWREVIGKEKDRVRPVP